ncbi:MAG: hypothetical protein H6662_15225 [Ardenticatenaceae bacterium]|nr:hypothetical protein [Ardenticatenaceae bacterium]
MSTFFGERSNQDTQEYGDLLPYAINFIGHQGKRYGYIDNQRFEQIINDRLGKA